MRRKDKIATRAGKTRWEWDCGGKVLLAERNAARDAKLSRVPTQGKEKVSVFHTGETTQAITWQWPGDSRVFLVPSEILDALARNISLAKDVIIAAGHLYREQHHPNDRVVRTSYRELAEKLGLVWAGGRLVRDLDDALLVARWLTIKNHPVIRKVYPDGRVREKADLTFGFINFYERLTVVEGKTIPHNKQPLRVCLSEPFSYTIKKLPAAPVPVAALEAAHKAPQRLRTPAKSLVYYLASRVPLQRVSLALLTLADILGYQNPRKNELRRAIENVVKVLHGVVVQDYTVEDDVYTFALAGKPIQVCQLGGNAKRDPKGCTADRNGT